MPRMTDEEFEAAVEEALESIPERFLEALENVAVVVEDEPDDYHFDILDEPECRGASIRGDELLGLYDGVSLPGRADGYDGFWQMPLTMQHPLAEIEIVPWDSSMTLLLSRRKDIVDNFRNYYPESENLEDYIRKP